MKVSCFIQRTNDTLMDKIDYAELIKYAHLECVPFA